VNRYQRVYVVLGAFFTIAGAAAYFGLRETDLFYNPNTRILISGVSFLFGVGSLLLAYLLTDRITFRPGIHIRRTGSSDAIFTSAEHREMELVHFTNEMNKKFDQLLGGFEELKNAATPELLNAEGKEQLLRTIEERLRENLSSDFLRAINENYADDVRAGAIQKELEEQCRSTEYRLRSEIEALSRRGSVNLVIGVVTTLAAVSILGSSIVLNALPTEAQALALHLVPRITLSVFVEVFSFFFLRLYSSGLSDIKYYQNELTNIESRFIALRQAIQVRDSALLMEVLKDLAATERNFVLKRGETTAELERSKIEQKNYHELIAVLVGSLKSKAQ
jgi:hypothetical protein